MNVEQTACEFVLTSGDVIQGHGWTAAKMETGEVGFDLSVDLYGQRRTIRVWLSEVRLINYIVDGSPKIPMAGVTLREELRGFTYAEFRPVFDRFSDQENWKAPIDVAGLSKADANLLAIAVEWFHGCKATTTPTGTRWRVQSPGYSC